MPSTLHRDTRFPCARESEAARNEAAFYASHSTIGDARLAVQGVWTRLRTAWTRGLGVWNRYFEVARNTPSHPSGTPFEASVSRRAR